MMLNHLDVPNWTPFQVRDWLSGLCDNIDWLKPEVILRDNICGRVLLLMTPQDLNKLGATKVDLQEQILEAVESLRFYNFNITTETLQNSIFKLACQSRSLQHQLGSERDIEDINVDQATKTIVLSPNYKDYSAPKKQRVSLDTLASVSVIVTTVSNITDLLSCSPFTKYDYYRSMKSLLLALSVELTSTAQRDQFVEKPNDIIEKCSKTLADYCDRIVMGTRDFLLIQPFQLETMKIKNLNDLGLVIKTKPSNCTHIIEKISSLSSVKKSSKLKEGDEIIQFDQCIVGWSPKNVERLVAASSDRVDIMLTVKKRPAE